jgi:hypothetical protein
MNLPDDQDEFETTGHHSNTTYKQQIKKAHKIYSERQIGPKVQSDFILSNWKLHKLIEDVKFIKRHYKEIKRLAKL